MRSAASTPALTVLEPGPLATIQDRGRIGMAAWGVSRSGAADPESHRLANALVGNDPAAATVEFTLGGFTLRAQGDMVVAVTGAPCPGLPMNAPVVVRDGQRLTSGWAAQGLRTYVAVRGGVAVDPVLGSRSTDLLSAIGPAPLSSGDQLPVGVMAGEPAKVDVAPVAPPSAGDLTVPLIPGPRADWITAAAWELLTSTVFVASQDSNRIGLRLEGPSLPRGGTTELVSEGVLPGAVQVPASGQPVVFLADAPVTGGYPVIGYVPSHFLGQCAQARPGQSLSFRRAGH